MSLLYKNKEDVKLILDIGNVNGEVCLEFSSDGGKHGTIEQIDAYVLTPKRLLQVLQSFEDYTEEEL